MIENVEWDLFVVLKIPVVIIVTGLAGQLPLLIAERSLYLQC